MKFQVVENTGHDASNCYPALSTRKLYSRIGHIESFGTSSFGSLQPRGFPFPGKASTLDTVFRWETYN